MIRSFYHHGAETPAVDLTPEQMRAALADAGGVLWVDLFNPTRDEVDQVLTRVFGFHPLSIEDCLSGMQQPNLNDFGDYVFFNLPTIDYRTPAEHLRVQFLDVYLGSNFVVTHHKEPLSILDALIQHVVKDEWTMSQGADVLVGDILEAIADRCKPALDVLSAAATGLEIEVFAAPSRRTLSRIFELQRNVAKLNRAVAPHLEVVTRLSSGDYRPIRPRHQIYFRRVHNRFAHLSEVIGNLSVQASDVMHAYNSVMASQTNDILRVVTVIIAILLPLTLVSSIYGMNVQGLPGLNSSNGSLVVVGVMCLIAGLTGLYFFWRGWL